MTVISVVRHGKRGTYIHKRCRCDRCTAANTAYVVARQQQARADRTVLTSGRAVALGQVHGRLSTYVNYCCRCESCAAANAKYVRQYRNSAAITGRPGSSAAGSAPSG